MARPVTLFTGQWADLKLDVMCKKAKKFGYDGVELACWGDHFEVSRALEDRSYCKRKWEMLDKNKLAVLCHQQPPGRAGGLRQHRRAAQEHPAPARVGRRQARGRAQARGGRDDGYRAGGAEVLRRGPRRHQEAGQTRRGQRVHREQHLASALLLPASGARARSTRVSRISPTVSSRSSTSSSRQDVYFGLEVHPTEIAFDIASAQRAIDAVGGHPRFGFNYDPSHFGYQGVDYVQFIRAVHRPHLPRAHEGRVLVEDAHARRVFSAGTWTSGIPTGSGSSARLGRGSIDFETIIRALNDIKYDGPLSVEWEDQGMDREHGADRGVRVRQAGGFPILGPGVRRAVRPRNLRISIQLDPDEHHCDG